MRIHLMRGTAALCLACACLAQQPRRPDSPLLPRYQANFTTTGAGKVTVQATSNSDAVAFEEGDIYCAAACVATVYVNGAAATATTLAVVGPIGVAAAANPPVAFSASNVGTGTTLKVFNIAAGGTLVLDLTPFFLPANGGGTQNLTIGSSGTATIQIQWVAWVNQ